MVFDGAFKFNETCLNENLLKGLDLLNNLFSVLLKFQSGRYALTSDIKQMFHQVRIIPSDRDRLRFLLELHIFPDSSSKAYGAVSYLRLISNSITCAFIAGKSRLAPIKENLLTKLELQAAVIASRMKATLINSLDLVFDSIYLWTDSKTVMQYITNDNSKYSPYVSMT